MNFDIRYLFISWLPVPTSIKKLILFIYKNLISVVIYSVILELLVGFALCLVGRIDVVQGDYLLESS